MNLEDILISDLKDPHDISIPLRFGGAQPNVYGVDPASSRPCEYGDFVGDTRRGGSVNFEEYTLIPHCNGTHTECVGHITDERISVRDCLKDVFSEALLITVKAENARESGESYPFEFGETDEIISETGVKKSLSMAWKPHAPETPKQKNPETGDSSIVPLPLSLIIRTVPNDDSKLGRKYGDPVPPFFSNEAIEFIVQEGFRHLLVDLPSIDRLYDAGKLSNHRIFWNVERDSREITERTRVRSTITELIYVPSKIKDGRYLLNLQIAPFESDAAPSRPVLFRH